MCIFVQRSGIGDTLRYGIYSIGSFAGCFSFLVQTRFPFFGGGKEKKNKISFFLFLFLFLALSLSLPACLESCLNHSNPFIYLLFVLRANSTYSPLFENWRHPQGITLGTTQRYSDVSFLHTSVSTGLAERSGTEERVISTVNRA